MLKPAGLATLRATIVLVVVVGLTTAFPPPKPSVPKVAGIATQSPAPTPTPSATPTPLPSGTPVPTPVPKPPPGAKFGFALSLAALPQPELDRTLADIKGMGAGWVRFDVEWSNIEFEGPGKYNWTDYDRAVKAARAHDLQVLAIIDYTPEWARRGECRDTAMCAPADPTAYGRFAGAVAARYSPLGVHNYEIWNEPNITPFFEPAANPGLYAAMLRSAYPAIKRADRSATVVTGGTAPADSWGGNMNAPDFLTAVYNAGGKGYFDAVGHHPYTYPFSAGFVAPDNAWAQTATLHRIMAARGDGAKRVWLTEYGTPTGGPGGPASNGYSRAETGLGYVTEALQARTVADAVRLYKAMPWAGPMFWYTYKDSGTSRDTNENFFGLLRAGGQPKPAYASFKKAINQ